MMLISLLRKTVAFMTIGFDWIVQCFTSPPTQYRLYGRRFLQVKRPNQQYQSTEGKSTKENNQRTKKTQNTFAYTQNGKTNTAYNYNTASPLVYNNMGWLGDSSHRGQGCQAWTAVGLPPWYPPAAAMTGPPCQTCGHCQTVHYICIR